MPKTKISEFSATAGNNTDIDGINISEGCPPSGINDAIRELMAQLKDFQAGTAGDSFNGPVGTTTPAAGAFTNFSASGTFALTGDQVQISEGGTGQTTANAAFNALAPSQSTHAGKYLKTDGTNTSWDAIEINTADITGTLPVANGGTGVTSSTGTGSVVLSASPTFTGTVNGAALTLSSSLTLSGGTANGVAYLNGSKVLTTGSALTYNGTGLGVGSTNPQRLLVLDGGAGGPTLQLTNTAAGGTAATGLEITFAGSDAFFTNRQNGYMAFGVNNAEAMRLTSTGLGIGTSSISAIYGTRTVQLQSSGGATNYVTTGTHNALVAATTDGVAHFGTSTASTVVSIENANGTALTVNASRNVGIGTSSPAYRLDVQGSSSPTIRVRNTSAVVSNFSQLLLETANTFSGLGNAYLRAISMNAGNSSTALAFGVNADGGGAPYEAMRLDQSGNLGIGTSSPITRLNVVDSVTNTFSAAFRGSGGSNIVGLGTTSGGAAIAGYTAGFAAAADLIVNPFGGNLGLGVTPSAWSSHKAFQLNGIALSTPGNLSAYLTTNVYYNGTNWVYINNGFATQYTQITGQHLWFTAASGTAGGTASFTQAMTLDASGQLLVGTTSNTGGGRIEVVSNATSAITTRSSASGAGQTVVAIRAVDSGATEFANAQYNALSHAWRLSGGTAAMTLNSGGNLLVGTTDVTPYNNNSNTSADNGVVISNTGQVWAAAYNNDCGNFNRTGSDGVSLYFNRSGSTVGSISVTTTATAFNTTSDYRLKDNQQPLTGSGAFIDALKPKTWDWKSGGKGVGFIAHEVQEVSPGSVVGTKDAVDEEGKPIMQAMEYGSAEFIANIIAELQSLRARVAQLEAK